jgi:hypothetical protein
VPPLIERAAGWVWREMAPQYNVAAVVRGLLGEAYDRLGQLDSGAGHFEALAATQRARNTWTGSGIPVSFAHQRLVVLYARMGRLEDARRHWKIFSETFTNPDPEVRHLIDEARDALAEVERRKG